MHPACRFNGFADMTGDPVLDGLVQVFPQVNFSTLIEVSISFKSDIDAAADYVIQNVLPNIITDDNNASTNEDLYIVGHQQVSDDTNTHLVIAPVVNDTPSDSILCEVASKYFPENDDSPMGQQFVQSPAAASISGQAFLPEENNSQSLLLKVQNSLVDDEVTSIGNQQNVMLCSHHLIGGHDDEQMQCFSPAEEKPGLPAFEDNLVLHDDGSPDMNIPSNYSVCLESLDNAITAENHKKNTLLSNLAAVSEMLEEVELNEAETKHVVSEASQAGNDILVKAKKLKETSTLAAEENNKIAGEVFAEKSILASEAQGLQTRLLDISEERNYFVSIMDEMHQSLQRRLDVAEAERGAAETEKIKRETMAQEMLKEQEVLLDGAEEESRRLEQQAEENAKLRELLMDKGHIVDALHGEMLGIFDNIVQLQYRVDTPLPADETHKLAASNMSSSAESSAYKLAVEKPPQQASSSLSSSVGSATSKLILVDEPLQLASSSLSRSVISAPSKQILVESSLSSSVKSAPSKPISFQSSLSSSVKSAPSKPIAFQSSLSSSVNSPAYKVYVYGPLQLASSSLSSSARSSASEYSCSSSKCNSDGKITDASCRCNFDSNDSWDVVEDE